MNLRSKDVLKGSLLLGTGACLAVIYVLFRSEQPTTNDIAALTTNDLCPLSDQNLEKIDIENIPTDDIYFVSCGGFF